MFKDTALYTYATRLIAFKGKENTVFKLALDNRTIKDLITFMNTSEQMGKQHVDSLGETLFNRIADRTTYSLFDRKKRGGKEYELRDTGNYWRSFKATVGNGFITIDSDPTEGLIEQFGEQIEGLTDESLQELINKAHEYFVNWYIRFLLPQ